MRVGISAIPRSRISGTSARSQGRPSSSEGNVWARMSTPPSMAARAPALLEGCAKTSLWRACAADAALFTMSSGMTTIASRRAQDPVKSFTTSAPASRLRPTMAAASAADAGSGSREGRT